MSRKTYLWALAGGRNMYDRLVHFSYGLLLSYPIRERFLRIGNVRGFWRYFLPLDLTMSTSMLYELIEWGAAVTVGSDLGQAYLGMQGDVWPRRAPGEESGESARDARATRRYFRALSPLSSPGTISYSRNTE